MPSVLNTLTQCSWKVSQTKTDVDWKTNLTLYIPRGPWYVIQKWHLLSVETVNISIAHNVFCLKLYNKSWIWPNELEEFLLHVFHPFFEK